MSKKKRKKRERLKKQETERNRGRVYCTILGFCDGPCREANLRRYERTCSEAFYLTTEGELPVKA